MTTILVMFNFLNGASEAAVQAPTTIYETLFIANTARMMNRQ